jgi:hypothetical protein
MKSLADALPPEIARQIHPDWRKNEAAYWAVRDQLLSLYQGKWIGFADGAVIASGTSPVAVFHAAEATGRNPFVTCVGREDEPTRMRRASFAYDGSYAGRPEKDQKRCQQPIRQFVLSVADTFSTLTPFPLRRCSCCGNQLHQVSCFSF